jgi:hypothetical protein
MMSIRESLRFFDEGDVNALHKLLLYRFDSARRDPKQAEEASALLTFLLDGLARDKKWIAERAAAMRDEAERIAIIGQTMQRAGLRSYTDKDGAIFVADKETR